MKRLVSRISSVFMVVLAGVLMPLLLWVALVAALRLIFVEWRVVKTRLLSGNVVCSIKSDCPPGYECIGGRCIPAMSS